VSKWMELIMAVVVMICGRKIMEKIFLLVIECWNWVIKSLTIMWFYNTEHAHTDIKSPADVYVGIFLKIEDCVWGSSCICWKYSIWT
jgi:hypothetical protein